MSSDAPLIDSMDLTDWVILFTPTSKRNKGWACHWIGLGPKVENFEGEIISPMPLSQILPRLPMVVLPLRYLYPVKSNFFKLVPELATASLSENPVGFGRLEAWLRQKA